MDAKRAFGFVILDLLGFAYRKVNIRVIVELNEFMDLLMSSRLSRNKNNERTPFHVLTSFGQ